MSAAPNDTGHVPEQADGGILLAVNAGSSSLKVGVYRCDPGGDTPPRRIARGQIDGIGLAPRLQAWLSDGKLVAKERFPATEVPDHAAAFRLARLALSIGLQGERPMAVGHRVVHGGVNFDAPVLVDDGVIEQLEALAPLAPLHQPFSLAPIRWVHSVEATLPQVACFDTAFHHGREQVTEMFGLPWTWFEQGVRRYGFHGISYDYIAGRLREVAPEVAGGRVIVAHLGNGSSLCALRGGRSVDTTMGFTALEGLPMGSRCGTLDPGVVLYMQQAHGMSPADVERVLYHESGLKGVSGISSDMRELRASTEPDARRALDYYVYRVAQSVGQLAASLDGLDALVFTGGIGENDSETRREVCERLAGLFGFALDAQANAQGDLRVSRADSARPVFVIPTDEEGVVARHTWDVLRAQGKATG